MTVYPLSFPVEYNCLVIFLAYLLAYLTQYIYHSKHTFFCHLIPSYLIFSAILISQPHLARSRFSSIPKNYPIMEFYHLFGVVVRVLNAVFQKGGPKLINSPY